MNKEYSSRLELTAAEKKMLRSHRIGLKDVAGCRIEQLQSVLNTSKIRAMEIKALYQFQSLPSIGIRFAHDLVSMGYYTLDELKKKNPAKLFDEFEQMIGAWADPCLEDQFRLVVHYANNKNSSCNWWDFTAERKAYRERQGHPPTRPKKPWYELEQYKKENRTAAKSISTKKQVAQRLSRSMAFIKKNYADKITLAQLSRIALLSPFHFQRSFKLMYERSPQEFITHFRLKKACQLLTKTKRPVNEIAVQCGFDSTSSFIRLFRKRFQQTPAVYRQNKSIRAN
jgi:AraC-like DNA-binding protein